MKLAIIGSRHVKHPKVVLKKIMEELPYDCTEIVSCGAEGVDMLAQQYAKEHGIVYKEIKASNALEKSQLLADYADSLLAFWDCTSKGTAVIISTFTKVSKYVKIICINK
ncbi:MAG: hypothetical protein J6K12_00240 [Clostridia bacterium]|nr:hypothetical protein [Clostridia bacterium]